MDFTRLKNRIHNQLVINKRLKCVCLWYLLFLMISVRKHSLRAAAQFSGLATSQFSRFLQHHPDVAVYNLDQLSKKQAKQFSAVLKPVAKGQLPWKVAILIDSTIEHRCSLHADNVKRFNHGKGFQIGHQWTNAVLIINDKLIPLLPIPFYTKSYCRKHNLKYQTENALVVEYIGQLNLQDYIGAHDPKQVVVLADSGYDDRKIQQAIVKKKWHFIIALNKRRSVKSTKHHLSTPRSKGWSHVAQLFKNHRSVKWQTIRIAVNRSKKKRMEFRIRQINGFLRYVGNVQLVCSQFKKRPKGRKKYLACSDLNAKVRQIIIGYRLRWRIEIFHKEVKMFLGFEDVATKWFSSVMAHVHWVYCVYILLNSKDIEVPEQLKSLAEKQHWITKIIENKEKSRVLQLLTRINGAQYYKTELQSALQAV
jgi:hypothetical protein